MAPFMGQGDEVLSVRARIRGVAAGAAFPLMTLDQLNEVVSKRKMVFDAEDILLKTTPQRVWRAAAKSPCVTIKNEEFPTPTVMTRAGAPPRTR